MTGILTPPDRFVSIHSHSTFSAYDGLGQPHQHIDFCLSNELDGWALTDHGNGNGLAHAHAHAKKLKKKGQKYRQIYGVEFYFVPSIKEWTKNKALMKDAKKKGTAQTGDGSDAGLVVEDVGESRVDISGFNVNRRHHLVVIAKNATGLANLFTLVKRSFMEGFYRFPRIDYEMLKEHGEGLVVSTACVSGRPAGIIFQEFPDTKFMGLKPELVDDANLRGKIVGNIENMIDRFTDCVGVDNFFLELQFNDLGAQDLTNRCVLDAAKKTGTRLISTADSHFPGPDLWEAREIYRNLLPGRMKVGEEIKLPEREEMKTMLYPKNAKQMWDEYLKCRDKYDWYEGTEDLVRGSIENGHDVAWQMCDEVWFDTTAKLPSFDRPDKSAFDQLRDNVKQALVDEGLSKDKVYVARALSELSDIKFLGFENYFLTLQKVMHLAEQKTLMGAGRGSGAGSLVNYLLGITHVDPIPHGLLWGRFLGRHRVGWPDIDVDAGDRDELIFAARELFGDDAVIPVSNFNTLKLKSLVKDVSKFFGVPFTEVNAVTGPLEKEVERKSRDPNMEKSMFVLKHDDCMKYSKAYKAFMEKYPDVEHNIKALFMMNRSVGRHAGGVLICPELEKSMPLIKVRGELQTPWTEGVNIRNLEENGFLKFDFLGLKQMKMVENCIRRILKKETGKAPTFADIKRFYDEKLNCRYVDPDDQSVFDNVYKKGKWPGIFQFTSSGARKFCKDAQVNNVTELAAVTAIYRPGPLKANVHRDYVKAKANPAAQVYDHPVIKEVLEETCGFIVFQESFMLLAVKLAGFTEGDSDKMRKTLVKKDLTSLGKKSSEKEALEKKFVDGCVEKSGMNRKKAQDLFDKIAYFSLYGFNKSHAIAYAIDSYYGAWLMTHYEKEWLATVLETENGSPKGLSRALAEIKEMGHAIAKVDVNYSDFEWTFAEAANAFVPPMAAVKGIGKVAMREIINERPFKTLDEMFFDENGNWKLSKANKTALKALCKIEAMDSLEDIHNGSVLNYRQLLFALTDDKNYIKLKRGNLGMTAAAIKKANKLGEVPPLFLETELARFADISDWTRAEKVEMSYDLTSAANTELLFPPKLMAHLKSKGIPKLHDIPQGHEGIGWMCIETIQRKKTKNGKPFMRCRVIDDESRIAWLRVWGKEKIKVEPYTLWLTYTKHDADWGHSTASYKMKQIL
jgi:DNA polymerase III subunit alpha